MLRFTLSKGIAPVIFLINEQPCVVVANQLSLETTHAELARIVDLTDLQWIVHTPRAYTQLTQSFRIITVDDLRNAQYKGFTLPQQYTQ